MVDIAELLSTKKFNVSVLLRNAGKTAGITAAILKKNGCFYDEPEFQF